MANAAPAELSWSYCVSQRPKNLINLAMAVRYASEEAQTAECENLEVEAKVWQNLIKKAYGPIRAKLFKDKLRSSLADEIALVKHMTTLPADSETCQFYSAQVRQNYFSLSERLAKKFGGSVDVYFNPFMAQKESIETLCACLRQLPEGAEPLRDPVVHKNITESRRLAVVLGGLLDRSWAAKKKSKGV